MEIPLPEIIDRISILKLKIENKNDPSFLAELKEFKNALKDFGKKGIKIKQEWSDMLYDINKYQWGLESSLKKAKEDESNLEELGKIYIKLQISNKKRVAVKNAIAEETKSGFKDIKTN